MLTFFTLHHATKTHTTIDSEEYHFHLSHLVLSYNFIDLSLGQYLKSHREQTTITCGQKLLKEKL